MKKSQITLFFLIGIVMLLIFGLVYYIAATQLKITSEAELEKMAIDTLKSKPITEYVSKCLGQALADGLRTIGEQGGYFFEGQPGYINNAEEGYVQLDDTKIAYLISSGRFRLLPFLDKYPGKISIQEQLELFVANRTKECTDFSNLQKKPELKGIQIVEEEPIAEIVFGENDVSVKLKYPIKILIKEREVTKQRLDFDSQINIRFKKIYYAVDDIIIQATQSEGYDIIQDTLERKRFKELEPYATITNASLEGYDKGELIILKDSASELLGEPYTFQFVRKK